jgi:hypothetical protein
MTPNGAAQVPRNKGLRHSINVTLDGPYSTKAPLRMNIT